MTAHEYLKAIRDKGLTQAEIAERTGIPQGTISKIERGQVGDVLSKTYLALKSLYDALYPWDGTERRHDVTPCTASAPTPTPTVSP